MSKILTCKYVNQHMLCVHFRKSYYGSQLKVRIFYKMQNVHSRLVNTYFYVFLKKDFLHNTIYKSQSTHNICWFTSLQAWSFDNEYPPYVSYSKYCQFLISLMLYIYANSSISKLIIIDWDHIYCFSIHPRQFVIVFMLF